MNDYLSVALPTVASFLVMWGMTRSKLSEVERRTMQLEQNTDRQLELVHSLRDVYVSREHFNEIMETIRESQKELKDDMKKILELLASRTAG